MNIDLTRCTRPEPAYLLADGTPHPIITAIAKASHEIGLPSLTWTTLTEWGYRLAALADLDIYFLFSPVTDLEPLLPFDGPDLPPPTPTASDVPLPLSLLHLLWALNLRTDAAPISNTAFDRHLRSARMDLIESRLTSLCPSPPTPHAR